MKSNQWNASQITDQSGRIAIITGSNSGIGFEAAKELAAKGATVVLAVRNQQKGDAALTKIQSEHPNAKLHVRIIDMASLKSVAAFSDKFLKEHDRLDLLINNAGIMIPPYSKTEDGFESQMGTNHMGHFALTAQLFPLLEKTDGSRIVNVSSGAHNMGNLDFDDLSWENRKYVAWKAYGDTKIANLYFTYELDRRLKARGSQVKATVAHPGWSATELQKSFMLKFLNVLFAQSQQMGALPTLLAAVDPNAAGGEYYGPSGIGQQRGYPKKVNSNPLSKDTDIAQRLWAVSEELTSTPFKI